MKRLAVASTCGLAALAVAIGASWYRGVDADIDPNEPLLVGDVTRNYRIVVPRRLPHPAPIVFAFCGSGDSTASMARYSQLDRLAAENAFILVYPAPRKSMWAALDGDSNSLGKNADVEFFDQLLAELPKRYRIDRERVYLMGMSNGASFAQLLASARSEAVAAVVAHSGSRPGNLAAARNPRPILLLVGQEDQEFAGVATDADRYRAAGHVVNFVSVPGLAHQWSVRHNAQMWSFLSNHRKP